MKILLIEDDAALRGNLAELLQQAGYDTLACGDGDEGLYCLEENACDLVILDRMLPGMDGLSLLKEARSRGVQTPVLMLTALDAVGDRVDGLDAGADDYLAKPFDTRELLARVRALVRRPAAIEDAQALAFGDILYTPLDRALSGPAGTVHLSKTLAALLELFLRSPTPTLQRGTLFSRVWGPAADVDEGILDTYVSLLRRRLRAVGSAVQLAAVRGVGYSIR